MTNTIRTLLAVALLSICHSSIAATTLIHAGDLLAVPGESIRSNQTIVVVDDRIVDVVSGFSCFLESFGNGMEDTSRRKLNGTLSTAFATTTHTPPPPPPRTLCCGRGSRLPGPLQGGASRLPWGGRDIKTRLVAVNVGENRCAHPQRCSTSS